MAITEPTCEGPSHRRPGSGTPGKKVQKEGPGHSTAHSGPRVCPSLAPPGPGVGSVGAQEAGLDDAHFFPGGGSLREERIPEHKSNGV